MYIKDGVVYANEQSSITVLEAKVISDTKILLTFSNGEKREFDAGLLDGKVFEPLKDQAVFQKPAIDHGVVTWLDGSIDCSPEYMYEKSCKYDG